MQSTKANTAQVIRAIKFAMWINPLIMFLIAGYVWWAFRDSDAQIYVLIGGALLIIGDFFLMRFMLKRIEAKHRQQQTDNVIIE